MIKFSRSRPSAADADAEPIVYDDGGSGLLEACRDRFAPFGCEIVCDARHAVWVKRADGARSVGLSPWLIGRYSTVEVLDDVEARLELTGSPH